MTYLGNTPTTQSFISGTDYFNGDGATIAFTLSRAVVSVNDIEAVVNNVVQQPNTAYTISGTTITFTSAPSSGTSNIYVRYLSTTTQSITPSQNTVSYSTLNSDNQSKLGISFKNRIINGAMVIDQRNAGASSTCGADQTFMTDRFCVRNSTTLTGKITAQQNQGSVTPPAGFTNYLGVTSQSAYSVGAGDYFAIQQNIEGFNTADFNFGSSNAKSFTLSFWVRSSLTGTFGGSFNNNAYNRSYPYTYTINSANTWEYKTITVAGDTTGTWVGATNSAGLQVFFGLGVGASNSGTANAWGSAGTVSATGATSLVAVSGATFYLTGVQLEVGTQATTFDYRSYGTELALCERYFQKSYNADVVAGTNTYLGLVAWGGHQGSTTTGEIAGPLTTFRCVMRTTPTITFYDISGNVGKCARLEPAVSTTNNSLITSNAISDKGFGGISTSGSAATMIAYHYYATAEL